MARYDNLADSNAELRALRREVRDLQRATPLNNSSMGRGSLRVDGGTIRIENQGGLVVEGSADISGTLNADGTISLSGTVSVTGPMTVTGTTKLNGATTIAGATDITGNTTLKGNLTVNSSGKIVAGNMTIDALGTSSGRIVSTGQLALKGASIYLDGSTTVAAPLGVQGNLNVSGSISGASKSFVIPHPDRPGRLLVHGSTESPTHGIEYWGTATLGANGQAEVTLPDYFESLALVEGRTVLVTPVGAPFPVGANIPADGILTLYGAPGRAVSWLVKATRELFDVEPEEEADR